MAIGQTSNLLHKGNKLKTDIVLNGADAVISALSQLKLSIQRKLTRFAMSAAIRPIAREAKRLAPRDSGLLRKSIGSKSKTYPGGATVGIVGPRGGFGSNITRKMWAVAGQRGRVINQVRKQYADPIKYAHLVEFGTAPHSLGGGTKLARKGKAGIGGGASHPGTKPQRFMQRAWDAKHREALQIFRDNLTAGIKREADKLRAKAETLARKARRR